MANADCKPDWKDAPQWATCLAKDTDGFYWWCEIAPQLGMPLFDPKIGSMGRIELANNSSEIFEIMFNQ